HGLRALDRDRVDRRRAAHRDPTGRALDRARIYRPRVRDLRARRARQPARHADCGAAARDRRKPHREPALPRTVVGAGSVVRLPLADAGAAAGRPVRAMIMRSTGLFIIICVALGAVVFVGARAIGNDYVFFAGYVVLQYIVLATAWNILGGYTGYVHFGSAAFFSLGAYASVFLHKFYPLPIPVLIVIGAVISGAVGLGMGYLTLRLRGAFFAIATLAMAVVLQTLIVNWGYVGGARGAYVVRPAEVAVIGSYVHYLFLL